MITRVTLILLVLFITNAFGIEAKTPSMNLFSTSSITSGQPLKIGDIVGAIFVGSIAYLFIVLPFVIGILSLASNLFKSGQGNDPSSGSTIIKLILTPLLWMTGGMILFATFYIFLNIFYSIDINSWIKMFLETRYETSVANLVETGTLLPAAKSLLVVLDVLSKIVFWTIPVVFGFLFVFLCMYIILIYFDESGDTSAFKKAFNSMVAATILFVLVAIYENGVSRVMFKNNPNIATIGNVNSAKNAFTLSLKYWIKLGLDSSK